MSDTEEERTHDNTPLAETFLDNETVEVEVLNKFSSGLCTVIQVDEDLAQFGNKMVRHKDRLTPINKLASTLLFGLKYK